MIVPIDELSISDYSNQFLLSPSEVIESPNWCVRDLASWKLSHHDSLEVVEVIAIDKGLIGFFLGLPTTTSGELTGKSIIAPFATATNINADRLENFLYDHGGRWIFILAVEELSRVYLDPCGSHALVYDTTQQRIASTATVMGSSSGFGRDWLDTGCIDFPIQNQFYPLGLTGDQYIARLMPNHYLDIKTMMPIRHWPLRDIPRVKSTKKINKLIETIVCQIKNNLKALAKNDQLYLSLTAGRDSRMLLACSKDITDRATCFTFDDPLGTGPVDLKVAKLLCDRFQLTHQTVPIEPANSKIRNRYLARIGYAGNSGKARDFLQAAGGHLDLKRLWLIGYAGEVGRSFYWMKGDTAGTSVDPANLLRRMNLPTTAPFIEPMAKWTRDLGMLDFYGLLDLMYLEVRMGTWAAPHLYGCAPFKNVIVPLCHRRIIEAMLQLPVEYRWQQNLAKDVIQTAWPELLQFPFQRAPGLMGLWCYVWKKGLSPRLRRSIDALGNLQGRNKSYDKAYNAARGFYRRIKK